VYFVPSGAPPHKLDQPLTRATHRFAMVATATLPYDGFFASDDEVFATSPTYTADTVHRFQKRFPDSILYFLLGSDSFSQIATWERWMELADRAHLVVLHRAHIWGDELYDRIPKELRSRIQLIRPFQNVPDPTDQTVYLLDHEPFPISATSIRERQQRGRPIRALVPHEVHSYIEKYKLYQHLEGLAHAD